MNFLKNNQEFLEQHVKYLITIIQEKDKEIKMLREMLNNDRVEMDPITQDDAGEDESSPSFSDEEELEEELNESDEDDNEDEENRFSNGNKFSDDLSNHVYVKPADLSKHPFVTEIPLIANSSESESEFEADDVILL